MSTSGNPSRIRVGIVGPCTAGKSTLISNLPDLEGIELRHIAQEHSYVQNMWQRISNPTWLIFLDVSYPVTNQRKNLNWTEAEYQEQQRRLAHARQSANIIIDTDQLTPQQVADQVLAFLHNAGVLK
jgi:ABC-type polar amino acid transport system ATPase subunit